MVQFVGVSWVACMKFHYLASIVAIIGNVPETDQILLVCHHGTLVVLVAHTPDSVHGIIIAAQLCLPPEGGSKLVDASPIHTHSNK